MTSLVPYRPTNTKNPTARFSHSPLDQAQPEDSLEAVKILVHTSVATMCYLRNLCADESFRDRYFGRVPGQHTRLSYPKFIMGGYPRKIGERHTTTKTLLRGKGDGRTDQILDWLELGVFDALDRKVLATMRITIFVDKPSPTNIVEAYTYHFKYLVGTGDLPRKLTGMEVSSSSGEALAVADVQQGVIDIVRRLVLVDQTLPALPENRFLTIQLFYTDDCPRSYEPPGFEKSDDWQIYFPKDERVQRDTFKIGQLDTGFHEVGFEVTALRCAATEGETVDEQGHLPSDLKFANKLAKHQPSAPVDHASKTQTTTQEEAGAGRGKTLESTNEHHSFTQDTTLTETQLIPTPPTLSQAKELDLSQRQAELLKSGRLAGQKTLSKGKPTISSDGEVVRCQCGWNKDDGDMIFCDYCETWQHVECYGYSDLSDSRIPRVYACYHCLFGGSEDQTLDRMTLLCLGRRALKIIDKDGYPQSSKEFAKSLHCDPKTATAVTTHLLQEGYITATQDSSSKGTSQKGFAIYEAVNTPAIKSKRAREYLDPLVNISQYYSVPEEATPLDYSLNFETVTAPPEASTAAGDQSMLQFSAERIAEPESNTTDDDELVPVVSRTSLSRFTGKSAMPTQVSNRLGSKRQSSAVDVLPRKRARGGRGSRAIQPLDVALER